MYDVRPVDETGDLDWQKISAVGELKVVKPKETKKDGKVFKNDKRSSANAYCLGVGVRSDELPVFHEQRFNLPEPVAIKKKQAVSRDDKAFSLVESVLQECSKAKRQKKEKAVQAAQLQKESNGTQETKSAQPQPGPKIRKRRTRAEKINLFEQNLKKDQERKRLRLEREKLLRLQREEFEKDLQMKLKTKRKQTEAEKLYLFEQKLKQQQEQERLRLEKEKTLRLRREELERTIQAEKLQRKAEKERQLQAIFLREKEELERIAEKNRLERQERENAILLERKKREEQKIRWLEAEARSEARRLREIEKTDIRNSSQRKNANHREGRFDSKAIFSEVFGGLRFDQKRFMPAFVAAALVLSLGLGGVSFASKGFGMQGKVLGVSQDGYANLAGAIENMKAQNFVGSAEQFSQAHDNFSQASDDLEDLGGGLLDAARFLPFTSKISSGRNAVEAGKHFSAAGQSLNRVIQMLAQLKQNGGQNLQEDVSLLDMLKVAEKNVAEAKTELDEAQKNVDLISIDDLPADKRQKFLLLKEKLPKLRSLMQTFLDSSHIFVELLGGNGPRKYLFLFQNNSEMRATGGFIGSYGLLDIANGHIKKFFIDGIFNPDGQLKDKIVPPRPIQKISAAWSLHDSNWFADFPTSAQKAIAFYEKTGGPTADGVISLTPTLMQKLLKITGPIEMPEYGVILDADNFIALTQYKVEVDYDKQENRPKKILSDLAPLLLEKLLNGKGLEIISGAQQALIDGLKEKHVLFYSQNKEIEDIISMQGWSGKLLPADKDYLGVINTNINGFKTDAVVEENIFHNAEIQADGSIIDTVKITRRHTGGNSQYDWLNKVNADYMRVYVPKGSKLLEVSGQTKEVDQPPLDYDALGFKRDSDVRKEEENMTIDPASGTRIYAENDKTVFANWVYVSPQESVTVTYKYVLPFRLFQLNIGSSQKIDSYSLVAQKQSGSIGSSFSSEVAYPKDYEIKWVFPQGMKNENGKLKNESNLTTDYFEGAVFENKSP